jgi:tubulin monoglycylase TTLL3/8
LKPGGKSRGRGIEIHDHLDDLVKSTMVSSDSIWIAQKYIETPMIILGKKFDIRVWVLVTSVEPLKIWMYTKPYLRFTAHDYDKTNLKNKFSNLTNATISKKFYGKSKSKSKGNYKITHNMWETEDFEAYLADKFAERAENPFQETLLPQIREGVNSSMLAVKDVLQHRELSHELFGYDFMVDKKLNVWLLEVNSSPSMEFSTPITEKLVKQMMPEMADIILDHEHGNEGATSVGESIGAFELIYT